MQRHIAIPLDFITISWLAASRRIAGASKGGNRVGIYMCLRVESVREMSVGWLFNSEGTEGQADPKVGYKW